MHRTQLTEMKKEKEKIKRFLCLSSLFVCGKSCGYRLEKPEIIHETYFACGS
jgi:hypothetical protein